MPRPPKRRLVCHYPQSLEFRPAEMSEDARPVILTVDEYESIRLIDREGLSQEACSEQMGVARTTVQKIYDGARRKIAVALVDGRPLRIEGGAYRLCSGDNTACCSGGCYKQVLFRQYYQTKGETIMRIAVTYENGQIFQHFGHTDQFKIYDVQDGTIVSQQVVDTGGQGHGALAGVLLAMHVDTLICGGIGGGAQAALASAGITLYGGVSGDADQAVQALISGSLVYNPNIQCSHHGEHHHGHHHHGGSCGSHGCGSSCGHE